MIRGDVDADPDHDSDQEPASSWAEPRRADDGEHRPEHGPEHGPQLSEEVVAGGDVTCHKAAA